MISIIDIGIGNVRAFSNIYKALKIPFEIVRKPEDLISPTHIILPGVGSFDNTINKIRNLGFEEPLNFFVNKMKSKVLGVCVGFQIMGQSSEEGINKGLGWIDARTVAIPVLDVSQNIVRLPHMGWNKIRKTKACSILGKIESEEFYFLHSFQTKVKDPSIITSMVNYKYDLVASIRIDNIYGIQFHPEKSHLQGLLILENFARV